LVLLSGRKIESEEGRQFIKQTLHARATEQSIALTINGHGDATIEAALKRAIAAFSYSKEGRSNERIAAFNGGIPVSTLQ
jgi:hypothetical protein